MLTPLGVVTVLCSTKGVSSLLLNADVSKLTLPSSALAKTAAKEVSEFFQKTRTSFLTPVDVSGSELEQLVWSKLQSIPYGETVSYKEFAAFCGKPASVRSIASAIGRNPVPIVVPCHRVIRSTGSQGLFSLGPSVKRYLLEMERTFDIEAVL
jgi:O-6-methylguanine DNA methyltransferase